MKIQVVNDRAKYLQRKIKEAVSSDRQFNTSSTTQKSNEDWLQTFIFLFLSFFIPYSFVLLVPLGNKIFEKKITPLRWIHIHLWLQAYLNPIIRFAAVLSLGLIVVSYQQYLLVILSIDAFLSASWSTTIYTYFCYDEHWIFRYWWYSSSRSVVNELFRGIEWIEWMSILFWLTLYEVWHTTVLFLPSVLSFLSFTYFLSFIFHHLFLSRLFLWHCPVKVWIQVNQWVWCI